MNSYGCYIVIRSKQYGVVPIVITIIIMSAWRKAGLTYTQYISVAAKTLRSALKPELQTASVLNRGQTEAYFTKYVNGEPTADPKSLQK